MNPPERVKGYRRGIEWLKHTENEPTDRAIQYIGSSILSLRADQPLLPIVAMSEAENSDFDVPFFKYSPKVVCTSTDYQHGVNVPGMFNLGILKKIRSFDHCLKNIYIML